MNTSIISQVARLDSPLYASKAEFLQKIHAATEPHQLNIVLEHFQKGKSDKRIHQLSDDDCRHVWNSIAKRGEKLGFSRRNSDHTFYRVLPQSP